MASWKLWNLPRCVTYKASDFRGSLFNTPHPGSPVPRYLETKPRMARCSFWNRFLCWQCQGNQPVHQINTRQHRAPSSFPAGTPVHIQAQVYLKSEVCPSIFHFSRKLCSCGLTHLRNVEQKPWQELCHTVPGTVGDASQSSKLSNPIELILEPSYINEINRLWEKQRQGSNSWLQILTFQ